MRDSVGGVALSLVIAAGVAGLAAGAARAEQPAVIAREEAAGPVAAYGGVVAWSHYVHGSALYELRLLVKGEVVRPRVKPRPVPFDVDLGPGAGPAGRPVAVYSRCRREPESFVGAGIRGGRAPSLGDACDIFYYDIAERRERRVNTVGRESFSEFYPSVWRDRIAFARIKGTVDTTGSERKPVEIVIASGRDLRKVRRVGRGSDSPEDPGGPTGIDLRGTAVAFTWELMRERCRLSDDTSSRAAFVFGYLQSEMWVAGSHGPPRVAERGCTGDEAVTVFGANFGRSGVLQYGLIRSGYDQRQIQRSDRRDHLRRYVPATGRYYEETIARNFAAAASDALTGEAWLFERTASQDHRGDYNLTRADLQPFASSERTIERPLP